MPGGVGHADLLPRHSIDLRGAGGDEEEGGGTTATAAILKFLRPYSIFTELSVAASLYRGSCMVLDAPEVYLSQINASDCTVVHGAIVDDTVCHICGRCPLVALGILAGTWPRGNSMPTGISKLFSI